MTAPWKVKASAGGGEFEHPEPGSHPAVLVALVDLGTHTETFDDKEKGKTTTKDMRKVYLAWELTDQPRAGQPGANHLLCRDYNLVFSEKAALRKLLEKWRGKTFADGEDFDLAGVLGKPCLLTVTLGKSKNTGNEYAKMDGCGPLPRGYSVPPAKRKSVSWSVGDDPAALPDWLPFLYGEKVQDVIARSKEATRGAGRQPGEDLEPAANAAGDDIAF